MASVLDVSKKVTENEIGCDPDDEKNKALLKKVDDDDDDRTVCGEESENIVPDEKKTREAILMSDLSDQTVLENEMKATDSDEKQTNETLFNNRNLTFIFVVGGPGGGKSTQCRELAQEIGYTHLSTGDLLDEEMERNPVNRPMIESCKREGKSVPPDLTLKVLFKAIDQSGNQKFLLDGFPRDDEIRTAFEAAVNTEPELVLFFDCSEEERERRILSRKEERVDDNAVSIRKRFKYYEGYSLPVIQHYHSMGKVYKIDAGKPMEEVSEKLRSLLSTLSILQCEEKAEASNDLEKDMLAMKL